MNIVNDYFKSYTKEISFVELRDNKTLKLDKYEINKDIPLPILTESLLDEIRDGTLEEELNMKNIINGIIYTIGVDNEFEYVEEYKKILESYSEDIEEYIFYKGIRLLEKEEYVEATIFFRALTVLNEKNINGLFNYALSLERIAKDHFAKEEEEKGFEFIRTSTLELEKILELDNSYPLAYYKLGYHYKFFGQSLKAKLIWKEYLAIDKDDLRLQEIRLELEDINDDVILESGLTYLTKGDYEKALDYFLQLLPEFKSWWELNYYIGISYKELQQYDTAIAYFEMAIKENNEEAELYNELGSSYFLIEDIVKGIEVFSQGINNIKDDYKLLFNRGIGYIQMNKLEEAYRDIVQAINLNPKDENMMLQKQKLEEIITNSKIE